MLSTHAYKRTIPFPWFASFSTNLSINGFERVENKAILVKEYEDNNGNIVYATLTLTVSTNDPRVEKPKGQKTSKEKVVETFEIEEE